ncbi:hypothetical protein V6Z11_D07G188900 [Gossypium hirsutum]
MELGNFSRLSLFSSFLFVIPKMLRIKLSHREGVNHRSSGSKKGRGGNNEGDGVGPSACGIHTSWKLPLFIIPHHRGNGSLLERLRNSTS